ncbi:MAG: AraC family transcriptional regulator [Myxococcales bacterium]|nr:AraC family transcriptional regulator [Myxococcales bacterium]
MSSAPHKLVHVGGAWRLILRDLGLDARAVLRRAGQPVTLLDGDGSRISLDAFYALHEAVEAEADDPTIALHAGQVVAVELFDPALFAALCSEDMNTAASRLGQFKRLVGPFSLDVDIGRDATTIGYRCKHRPDLPGALGLSEMVFLVALARRATRQEIVPRQVTAQKLPTKLNPYVDYFRCPLHRGESFTVEFTAHDVRLPFLTHNTRMWETFEPDLRRRMAAAHEETSTSDQVEAALFELLPSGRAQIRDVARELGIGTRTLQRRLATEGTTWLEILNRTRERLARHYLRTTRMSPAEVSFLLGFEDPNSLFRAFQRWTGTTPESWRAEARSTS